MPAVIDSSPDCVTSVEGAEPADDSADFILQANYEDCAGFMTFGPGTTYGEGGAAADTAYYVLTWIGIAFMVAALIAWVVVENRRLIVHSAQLGLRRLGGREGGEPPGGQPA
jgi:hypothetical protein